MSLTQWLHVPANVISKADGKSKWLANYVKSTFSAVVNSSNWDETFERNPARFVLNVCTCFETFFSTYEAVSLIFQQH